MNATDLTFGVKEVIEISCALIALSGFIYAMKRNNDKNSDKIENIDFNLKSLKAEVDEKFMHAKNAKKANIQYVMETIEKNKEEVEKKEEQLYNKISELRKEQKDAHDKLWIKLDSVEKMQFVMNTTLSELNGFLKAKSQQNL